MSTVEDQVREALRGLADEARPAPLLQRLEAQRDGSTRVPRSRLTLAAVAAAVVGLLVAAVALWAPDAPRLDPAEQPPKLLRLSEEGTLSPGRALLAVTLAADSDHDDTPAYVLARGATEAVALPISKRVDGAWNHYLSADGTTFVRQSWVAGGGYEMVDLRTGTIDEVAGTFAYCPTLSPDGRLVAAQSAAGKAALIDRRTGLASSRWQARPALATVVRDCGYSSFGWAPDSDRLAIRSPAGTEVRDRQGRRLRELPGRILANSSMSWSPDGQDLLMYRLDVGGFSIVSTDTARATRLRPPDASSRPLGWAGDRVVWLVGDPGRQRLVTTDRDGGDQQPWMRLAVGGRSVDNITWSRALSGRG